MSESLQEPACISPASKFAQVQPLLPITRLSDFQEKYTPDVINTWKQSTGSFSSGYEFRSHPGFSVSSAQSTTRAIPFNRSSR